MFGDIVFVQSESNTTWLEAVVDEVIDDKHIHVTYNLGGLKNRKKLPLCSAAQALPVAPLLWYTQELYLPFTIKEKPILVEHENGWRVDNTVLNSKYSQLSYRWRTDDASKLKKGVQWGSVVFGHVHEDGWLKVTIMRCWLK